MNDVIFNNWFYTINELKAVLKSVGLQIIGGKIHFVTASNRGIASFRVVQKGLLQGGGICSYKTRKRQWYVSAKNLRSSDSWKTYGLF